MITYPTNKLQKVLLTGGCEQNGTPTPDNPIDIVCNNGVLKLSPNLFDKNDTGIGNGYVVSSSGEIVGSTRGHTGYFKVKPNITYHVTLDVYMEASATGIAFYDDAKKYVAGLSSGSSYGKTPHNFTVPNNNSIVYARLTLANNIASTDLDVIQIEQGSTATPYMPYGIYTEGTVEQVTDSVGNTATAERLLAVGNYKDMQEILSGVVTRNVGIKVFDGTENWTSINTKRFMVPITNSIPSSIVNSTHYVYKSGAAGGNSCRITTTGNFLINGETTYTNVNAFKQFLADQYTAGTPVIIVYPLATPTTEQVTPQPLVGSSATITAGSIDNLSIESSTIAELKKRYIGEKEVKRVYIGDNLVYGN